MGFCQSPSWAYGDEVSHGPNPDLIARGDIDALRPVAAIIAVITERLGQSGTAMVGLAGGVAVGKSTAASALRAVLDEHRGLACSIVSSDGFLLPNATLLEKGIFHRKGFPESYDRDAINAFILTIRDREFPVAVPMYDHLIHDVLDATTSVQATDVVLFEGVNTLGFASSFDLSIYIDAAESSMRQWYLDRVLELRRRSVEEPSAFFASFASLSDEEFAERAISIWEAVNLPNLREHIEPTRALADVVIRKAPDHSIESVTIL
jgi:type I pantothenate kinase